MENSGPSEVSDPPRLSECEKLDSGKISQVPSLRSVTCPIGAKRLLVEGLPIGANRLVESHVC